MTGFEWLQDHARNTYSQFGEDGVLAAIFSKIRPINQWCFECGAADGLLFSNTRRLIENGWRGVLVEADKDNFNRLVENSKTLVSGGVFCVNETVGDSCRTDDILKAVGAPVDIDLVVIDVDGQDFYLLNSMVAYRPRVVVIEFNPNVDGEFLPPLGGTGQAGLKAIERLAAGKFYVPVWRSFSNLILVQQPLDALLREILEEIK